MKFNDYAMREAEEEYKRLKLTPVQRGMVESLVQMLGTRIPMRHMAMKGFAWRTIQKWQVENHKTADQIPSLPPNERLKAVKDMVEDGKKTYLQILHSPELEYVIIDAFDNAFKQYQKLAAASGR
ncbi:MAG: hypothetical protein ACXAEU_13220 [Candidatus Hodarchaeales archaeon]